MAHPREHDREAGVGGGSASRQSAVLQPARRGWLDRPGVPELLLVVSSVALYARSLGAGFVYDDHSLIGGLGHLRWSDVPRLFTHNVIQNHLSNFYRPLLLLWIDLVHRLAGTSSVGWHLNAILLHSFCAVLVFYLACDLLHDRGAALLAAGIFLVHPTHVEPVTWISDMADPLMTIFLLLASLAFVRWLRSGKLPWAVAAWLLATAGCFIKEIGVVMPALLLVLVLCVEIRVGKSAIFLFATTLCCSVAAFLAVRSHVLHGFSHPLSKAATPNMMLTVPAAFCFYLSHLIFPVNLGLFYPLHFIHDWRSRDFLLPLIALIALALALAWLYGRLKDRRIFWFGLAWVLAPLLPPLYLKLFPKFELVHDRYLFLPTVALGVVLAAIYQKLRESPRCRRWSKVLPIVLIVLLGGAVAETISYQGIWQSDLTLFRHSLKLTPQNDRAMVNLGVTLLQEGHRKEGTALLRRALQIQPKNALALFDLGNEAWKRGDAATAAIYFEKAVALEAHPRWLLLLANANFRMGRIEEARMNLERALAATPKLQGAHLLLGGILLNEGNPAAAIQEIRTELLLFPGEPAARRALQLVEEQSGAPRIGR